MGILPTSNEEIPYSQELIDRIMRLRIIDDTFFRVFANDKYAISEMIRIITGKDIEVIDSYPQVYLTSFLREGIVDSFNLLSDNSYCILEMQNENIHNDLKRCRFYSSLVTVNKTYSNMEFNDIPNVAVIYIKDYTEGERSSVSILSNGDGYTAFIINSVIDDGSYISDLMKVIVTSDNQITDEGTLVKYPKICERFNAIKANKEVVSAMCKIMEDYADEKVISMIKNLMETTKETFEEACRLLKINASDMQKYRKMI